MANEYFSHDLNARNDRKMVALIHDFKATGYGIYWGIVEMLHEEEGYLELDDITCIAIAKNLEADIEIVRSLIDKCVNVYKLFTKEGNQFTSARVLRNGDKRMEIIEQRSVAGKASAAARSRLTAVQQNGIPVNDNPKQLNGRSTSVEQNSTAVQHPLNKTQQRKGKEIKGKERKEENPTDPKLQKPTLAPPMAAPEKEIGGKEEKNPEPFWKPLVAVWNDFVVEKFDKPPLFAGQDPKFFKSIVEKLKKRAAQAKVPWTETSGPDRLKIFLQWAFKDEWLAKHFILKTLDSKFEEIGRDPKKIVEQVKKQEPPCADVDVQYLYERFLEGEMKTSAVLTTHFDLLKSKGKIALDDQIFKSAREKRIDSLVGGNFAPDNALAEDYKAGNETAAVKADFPKLEALAKRIAVFWLFEKYKGANVKNIF